MHTKSKNIFFKVKEKRLAITFIHTIDYRFISILIYFMEKDFF
jgi:hypothetical protein